MFTTKLHGLIKIEEFFRRNNYIYLKVVNEKLYRSEAMTITLQQYRLLNTMNFLYKVRQHARTKRIGIFVLGIFSATT